MYIQLYIYIYIYIVIYIYICMDNEYSYIEIVGIDRYDMLYMIYIV